MKQKTHYDVLGWQMNCSNYQECKLCYGCRNYDSKYLKCNKCTENKKNNICNRTLHTEKILSKMIKKQRIEIN